MTKTSSSNRTSTMLMRSQEIADKIAIGEFTLCNTPNKSKSRVWAVFAKINDGNGVRINGYVCCQICRKVFTFTKTSCTSNLVKHKCYTLKYIQRQQESPHLTIEVEKPKLEILNESLEYNTVENLDSNLVRLLTKCLIKNCRSYELIMDDDFKAVLYEFIAFGAKFGTIIDVEKLLPSPKTIARSVNEVYLNCFDRVKAEIALIKEDGFGLAIKNLTHNFLNSYIALTIHFIKDGVLTWRLLGLRSMEGEKCTSKNVSEKVEMILKDYDCKLSSKTIMVRSGCEDITKSHTLPCISYLLQNALQNSVAEVPQFSELVSECIKLVHFLKSREYTIFAVNQLSVNHWTSIYNALVSIANHWDQIEDTVEENNDEKLTKNINFEHLKAAIKILQPFAEAIETLEEHDNATLHLVMVYLHELKKSCDQNGNEFTEYDFVQSFKAKLLYHLDQVVTEHITILHKLALFLYPPTKKLVQFTNTEKESIEAECMRLMKCFEDTMKPNIKQEFNYISTPVSKRRKLFLDFVDSETNKDPNEDIIQELQIYKMTRIIDSEDFDVFNWWELQKDNFPLLYKLSRTVLATPASTSSTQQIFTTLGSLLSDKMTGLDSGEANIEQIAFIKFNADLDLLFNF